VGCKVARLGFIVVAALLVAACSGGAPATATPTTVPTSGSTAVAETTSPPPSVSASPLATNAAGIRTCVSSSEGAERTCALEAGTYATEFFVPRVTYTVPSAGWASLNREAASGNFHLFPPGGGSIEAFQLGTTDAFTILSAGVAPGRCTGLPSSELEPTFDGLVEFLTTNPRLRVIHVADTSVGGLDGRVLDIAYKESDRCPDGDYTDMLVGVSPSHGAFGITPQVAGIRLYLLRSDRTDAALVIEVDDAKNGGSDFGDGESWYRAAQAVIDTVTFAP
jgi:hypothetical protein